MIPTHISKWLLVAAGVVAVAFVGIAVWQNQTIGPTPSVLVGSIDSFIECAAAGYPIMESYPRQCAVPGGPSFTENIGNVLEQSSLIRLTSVQPNQTIASPLTLTGEARGYWYFEASFPVELYDSNNLLLASGIATAQGDWMTENFVPFTTTLTFSQPVTATGSLILKKDNPSGDPANDDSLVVPVVF